MAVLFAQKMLILFIILAAGSWVGRQNWRGFSLGSAGVLFVGLIFGHFGYQAPQEILELGLLLFVYAVGLQAGPQFFRSFRRNGLRFVSIALAVSVGGALAVLGMTFLLKLPPELATGMYTGALTCTPALAAAIDVAERLVPGSSVTLSVGYGAAYPFGMMGVVFLVQLLPRLLRRNIKEEEQRWKDERQSESPALQARQFLVSNPNCHGKRVSEINPHRMLHANISRIKRGEHVFAATPDIVLNTGDIVMVVGPEEELEKMRVVLGEERSERMDVNSDVLSLDVEVLEETLTGKTLAQMRLWERYTVVITRIRRQGVEIAPAGATTLEMGDYIRVVGEKAAVEAFAILVHGSPRKADETNMVSFFVGLLLGIALGSIPVPIGQEMDIRLGPAGGAFLVSLIVGHYGGLGPFKLHVPAAAKNLSRELGLMLFLAGAGANAGAHFIPTLLKQGAPLILAGVVVTVVAAGAGIAVMHWGYKMNLLATWGALCACMTNPPGLAAANARTETDLPTIAYASVYPVSLIFKILMAQVLVNFLLRWF